jgi:hypothetical protein
MMNCLPIFRKYSEDIIKYCKDKGIIKSYKDRDMICLSDDYKKLYNEFSHIFIYLANEKTHFAENNDDYFFFPFCVKRPPIKDDVEFIYAICEYHLNKNGVNSIINSIQYQYQVPVNLTMRVDCIYHTLKNAIDDVWNQLKFFVWNIKAFSLFSDDTKAFCCILKTFRTAYKDLSEYNIKKYKEAFEYADNEAKLNEFKEMIFCNDNFAIITKTINFITINYNSNEREITDFEIGYEDDSPLHNTNYNYFGSNSDFFNNKNIIYFVFNDVSLANRNKTSIVFINADGKHVYDIMEEVRNKMKSNEYNIIADMLMQFFRAYLRIWKD